MLRCNNTPNGRQDNFLGIGGYSNPYISCRRFLVLQSMRFCEPGQILSGAEYAAMSVPRERSDHSEVS